MKEFFIQNQEEFILYFLSNPELDLPDKVKYETMLSSKLPEYINKPQMLSLPLPVINRVLTKYLHNYKNDDDNHSDVIEFLFKCLDKYPFEASCLFSEIDLSGEKTEYLYRLLNEYSDKFDFHFINSSLLVSIESGAFLSANHC